MATYLRVIFTLALLSASLAYAAAPDDAPAPSSSKRFPSFPQAEGAGAYTPGGRGGKVFCVTTLGDYLPGKEAKIKGSLREAVEAKGPRTIVFRVAGYIDLHRPLEIKEPFITIAGQSAPGGGICLRHWSLEIKTHDVVVRYLRIRPGDTAEKEMDAVSCSGQNVIIDHCSTSFGIDETLSTNGDSGDLTVQWCTITESLNHSVHHKGAHGYGSLISGTRPITYHHNLYAFHRSRNPRPGIGQLDFRNNVIVGWGDWAGYCGNDELKLNYVNNFLRPAAYSRDQEFAFRPGGPNPKIFIAGNIFKTRPETAGDQALIVRPPDGMTAEDVKKKIVGSAPFPVSTVATDKAETAYERVLKEGGATLPLRDAYDARVMDLVRAGAGRIIDSQNDVGGWPDLKAGKPAEDSDLDGMPDEWEKAAGLNPKDPADAARDCNGDGFTNIEKFLDGLDPKKPFAWICPPEISAGAESYFLGSAKVTLATATAGAEIRYTLDGAEPSASSKIYSGPFEIKATATIRAKAYKEGKESHVSDQLLHGLTMHDAAAAIKTVNGINYTYYENGEWRGFPDLDSLKPVKTGSTDKIGIGPTDRVAGYGLKFTGYVSVPAEGVYTFYLRSNELSLLKVDGDQITMSQSRKREYFGPAALRAGLHAIEASIYFPTEGPERTLEVSYQGPGVAKQLIPPSALFRPAD